MKEEELGSILYFNLSPHLILYVYLKKKTTISVRNDKTSKFVLFIFSSSAFVLESKQQVYCQIKHEKCKPKIFK